MSYRGLQRCRHFQSYSSIVSMQQREDYHASPCLKASCLSEYPYLVHTTHSKTAPQLCTVFTMTGTMWVNFASTPCDIAQGKKILRGNGRSLCFLGYVGIGCLSYSYSCKQGVRTCSLRAGLVCCLTCCLNMVRSSFSSSTLAYSTFSVILWLPVVSFTHSISRLFRLYSVLQNGNTSVLHH